MPHLGYERWENLQKTIGRAMESCINSGTEVADHFREVTKMISLGKGAERPIKDNLFFTVPSKLVDAVEKTSEELISGGKNEKTIGQAEKDALDGKSNSGQENAEEEKISVTLSSEKEVLIRKSVKEALDAYETLMDDYKDAMSNMSNGDFSSYLTFWNQYTEMLEKIENMESDLTDDETWYYLEVSTRVIQKMGNA